MNGTQAYILSKGASVSYVDKVLEGVTLINGANCEIDSITPSPDGKYNTVVFAWIGNQTGQKYTSEMQVFNGEDGIGIKQLEVITVEDKFHLQVTYTDDTTQDVGEIPLPTVEVGDTVTVEYDEGAKVTQRATATGIKLDFQIPRGQDGKADPVWNIV